MAFDNRARRLFTGKERLVLLADSNGRCRACGADLRAGFHADHVTPFSQGGATDVNNGQALCPSCNQHKGAKTAVDFVVMSQESGGSMAIGGAGPADTQTPASAGRKAGLHGRLHGPWTPPLRPWQQQGVGRWLDLRTQACRDMMVVACPGSGKTNLALYLARLELAAGRCSLVVIVAPTRQLKKQWARSAFRLGDHIDGFLG